MALNKCTSIYKLCTNSFFFFYYFFQNSDLNFMDDTVKEIIISHFRLYLPVDSEQTGNDKKLLATMSL